MLPCVSFVQPVMSGFLLKAVYEITSPGSGRPHESPYISD